MKAQKDKLDLLSAVAERAAHQRRKGKNFRLPLAEDMPPVEVIKLDGTRVLGDRQLQYGVMRSNKSFAWLRVCVALDALAAESDVKANPVTVEFLRVVRELAGSAATADSPEEAFDPIDALLPNGVIGARSRVAQANRRKGKPGTNDQIDVHGIDRDTAMRRHHAHLVEQSHPSPTSQTATDFGVSRSTVQRARRDKDRPG